MPHTKRAIQPLHVLTLRPIIITLLPISRLLMFPLLHDPRRSGAQYQQIRNIAAEH